MDIFTQALLGGVLAQTVAKVDEKKRATIIGICAGLLADADILIRSASDPLLTLEYHRHFTHSIFFTPLGAAIAWLILWPFMRQSLSAWRVYVFCLLGYSLSGVLDACTSYGTKLFWPLINERISWNLISIIDPAFSLILLFALIFALRYPSVHFARYGLLACVLYLSGGYLQWQRADTMAMQLMDSRGHLSVQRVVKPTLGNILLYRSVYIYNNRIYVDALRVGLGGNTRVYEGSSVALYKPGQQAATTQDDDIQRFIEFSDGFVAYDPEQEHVLGDIRYSMLPTSVRPLWGIVLPERTEQHVDFRFYRNSSKSQRKAFINMLLGRLK